MTRKTDPLFPFFESKDIPSEEETDAFLDYALGIYKNYQRSHGLSPLVAASMVVHIMLRVAWHIAQQGRYDIGETPNPMRFVASALQTVENDRRAKEGEHEPDKSHDT